MNFKPAYMELATSIADLFPIPRGTKGKSIILETTTSQYNGNFEIISTEFRLIMLSGAETINSTSTWNNPNLWRKWLGSANRSRGKMATLLLIENLNITSMVEFIVNPKPKLIS